MTEIWIQAEITKEKNGKPLELIHENRKFVYQADKRLTRPHLVKWLQQHKPGFQFTLETFYKEYPKQKLNHQANKKYVVRLIEERRIIQLGSGIFQWVDE